MKIQILRETRIKGEFAKEGSVVDASQEDAEYLIGTGKAKLPEENAKKPENKEQKKKRFTR